MVEGLFMFSRKLQMMCVMASGSSSPGLLAAPPPLEVVGRLDASDCVMFANDVIVPCKSRH